MELSVAAGAKLNSVRTILFRNKKASEEVEVLDALKKAEAIFMAGGDQSEYLDYWKGTDVQSIIQSKLLSNVTIGGTSAGCMVLGNWVYSGEIDSVISEEALADPYNKYITIMPAFLKIPYLESFITDTHFGIPLSSHLFSFAFFFLWFVTHLLLCLLNYCCVVSDERSHGSHEHLHGSDLEGCRR